MENADAAAAEHSNKAMPAIMDLENMIRVPMSLHAVVRLNVPDAIWQDGANTPLSAAHILSHEHLDSCGERTYYPTEIGKTLVTDAEGLSYAPYVLQHHQDALVRAWPLVHEAVLDPTSEPFVKANGEGAYRCYGKKPEMNGLMQKAMSGVSVHFMRAILNSYDGIKGVKKLVDVGGSAGDCLRMILHKHS
ncbi:hypothetical protein F3Y22_tig00110065pilonHSYRG00152 [Hibiscus syriacus]|uniref:O-methyltransferase C-terminal domain-containing protein n=1 Tax=Hibiscus syriacus TaxID=106335 RepID=A0A6A3BQ56_HIBSY|nr:hypothetical protein F3Y22_tig00110065pilonHSYRG00152 [Hibiscus syriacus]